MKKYFSYLILILLPACLFLSACSKSRETYQGYVEGEYRYISVPFAGRLTKLFVKRGDIVKLGTPLFQLDQQPELDHLAQLHADKDQAIANQQRAKAALPLADITLSRQKVLWKKGAASKESLDTAQSQYDQTVATLAQSTASIQSTNSQIHEAEWALSQKTKNSSLSGFVFDTFFYEEEFVPASRPVLALLAPENIKFIFFVPEKARGRLHIGQSIQIQCENCQSQSGQITYLSPQAEFTPPVIFSDQRREKLVFKIEAKAVQPSTALYPGQPIWIDIFF